jgi:hypothetical protein
MGQLVSDWSGEGGGSRQATFELFMDRLVGWNLGRGRAPVPPRVEAVEDEDDDMVIAITNKWTEAVLGVPAPLESGDSSSGETSAVESVLTEIPSESLAS